MTSPREDRTGDTPTGPDDPDFLIVGVGASAGGLEAFSELLGALPERPGLAVVLIQHLDPHHESQLVPILGRTTSLPVIEAIDGLELEPDRVYVIPPQADMTVEGPRLRLHPREASGGRHLPVDEFLKSLAREREARAVGVVLSGTGADGALGLAEIKAAGGITFAQDDGARHDGMPRSAIATGAVDLVLPPAAIARELARLGQAAYFARPAGEHEQADRQAFDRILARVRAVTGVDFGPYRDSTIRRRILRRMALRTAPDLEAYASDVEQDDAEAATLSDDLLVNVTSFFREPQVFEALQRQVFPELLRRRPETIRIWVSGCSTGQEAYSIAIALIEFLDGQPVRPEIQIFATDISEKLSIEKARAGRYPRTIESELSPERLRRFFVEEDSGYRVSKAVRDLCIFARQDVGADPPFSRVDLVSCRNLLIYFSPALQRRVLSVFHYALNPSGFLMLGVSETVGASAPLFSLVDRHNKLYVRNDAAARHYPSGASRSPSLARAPVAATNPPASPTSLQRDADNLLSRRFAPPGVLIDDNLDILQFRGVTRPYLEPPPGEATLNLLRMARGHLALDLGAAVREARASGGPVRRTGVRLQEGDTSRELAIEVLPMSAPAAGPQCFLVLFEESDARLPAGPAAREAPATASSSLRPKAQTEQLQLDLAAAQDYLQTVIEQHEAAQEELRSANEEVLSSNEELQSTNEELETAKEELQSANEELTTVNEELQSRNAELAQTNNDLSNLLGSVRAPIVMLGRDLRIRRFNSAAARDFDLLDTDRGRSIAHLRLGLGASELEALLARVLRDVVVLEVEVHDRDGRWSLLRIHPYRTVDDRIDGVVLLLIDIDDLKRTQAGLAESAAFSQAVVDTISQPLLVLGEDLRVELANPAFYQAFRSSADECVGQPFLELCRGQWDAPDLGLLMRDILPGRTTIESFELRRELPGLGARSLVLRARALEQEAGRAGKILVAIEDVTDSRRATEIEIVAQRLEHENRRMNEFLSMLSHELRNPLAPISNATQVLRLSEATDPDVAAATGIIERQVQHMKRLVDDLLDVSRIINGKIKLRKQPAELAPLLEQAIETTRPRIEARRQSLTVSLPDAPVWLEADFTRMVQVFANLLDNASKYTPEGGRIDLVAELEPGPAADAFETEVAVRVKDTGDGISAALLERVFDLFYQSERTLDRAPGGLGLGLTLVRNLVSMHGGSVGATSAGPGQGSEFVVRLPALRLPAAASHRATPPNAADLTASRTVLVVEDHDEMRETMAMLLRQLGHDVRTAADAPTALAVALAHPPEVVLLDIGLPGIDGYALAETMRSRSETRQALIVALTGYGQEEDRQRALASGFDAHLTKPVSTAELQATICVLRPPAPETR